MCKVQLLILLQLPECGNSSNISNCTLNDSLWMNTTDVIVHIDALHTYT